MHTIAPLIEVQEKLLQLTIQLRAIADRDPELAAALMQSVCQAIGSLKVTTLHSSVVPDVTPEGRGR